MPIYRSTLNEPRDVAGVHFGPCQTKEIKRYVALDKYPFLVKLSEDPPIDSRTILLLEYSGGNPINVIPGMFTLDTRKSLIVKDGPNPAPVGSKLRLQYLWGETDNLLTFVPYHADIEFERREVTYDGNSVGIWSMSNVSSEDVINEFPYPRHSVIFPFYSVVVTAGGFTGDVMVYSKSIHQVVRAGN